MKNSELKNQKLDKTIFNVNQKVKHELEDFQYLQAVAFGFLGKNSPKMEKVLTGMRKHVKI